MKEAFEFTEMRDSTIELIARARIIMEEYQEAGFVLTVRQLFYQFVTRGWIENSQRAYQRIGNAVGKGRLYGFLDWDLIEDRARRTVYPSHFDDPADLVDTAVEVFRVDRWEGQKNHVEVMVEKDALSGVMEPVCADLDVRFTANRGYSSLSHMYRIGKRIGAAVEAGKIVWILYFGDHDPSGMDMDRDILERLERFSGQQIELVRMALTMDQITRLNPPENPAKLTDARARAYIAEFGASSWELDALEPNLLAELVTTSVTELRDDDLWQEQIESEQEMREELEEFVDDYRSR